MTVFMLNTDSVTGSADSLNTIANNVKSTKSSVNSYDTSNEDGFDFAKAKSTITNNLDACATKVSNTMNVLKSVVTSHTNLQTGMKFESSPSETTNTNNQTNNTKTTSLSNSNSGNSSGYSGYGGYSGYSNYGSYVSYGTSTIQEEKVDLFKTPIFALLIKEGIFNIVKEKDLEKEIKDQTTLVIKANSKDEKDQEYIAMVTELALINKIPVTFVEKDDDKEETTISLVKKGEVIKEYEGYQKEKTIKEMFEKYQDDLEESADDSKAEKEKREKIEEITKTILAAKTKSILYRNNTTNTEQKV